MNIKLEKKGKVLLIPKNTINSYEIEKEGFKKKLTAKLYNGEEVILDWFDSVDLAMAAIEILDHCEEKDYGTAEIPDGKQCKKWLKGIDVVA